MQTINFDVCRNYSSHVRSKDAIEASGAYEREHFHPTPLIKYG